MSDPSSSPPNEKDTNTILISSVHPACLFFLMRRIYDAYEEDRERAWEMKDGYRIWIDWDMLYFGVFTPLEQADLICAVGALRDVPGFDEEHTTQEQVEHHVRSTLTFDMLEPHVALCLNKMMSTSGAILWQQ